MGLCKCPKKRVTNLFCFVHRVNVCEDCMIKEHSRCIVHSYLQWLQDSDYERVCLLCAKSLDNGEVVRLCCHDLFHLSCIDDYVQSRPPDSSLMTLKCPRCKDSFFPPPNMISPVADQLRKVLKEFLWGRKGLGIAPADISLEDDEILTSTISEDRVPSSSLGLDTQLTSTPMTSHSGINHDTISHAGHVTLHLYDQPINRSLGGMESLEQHQQLQNYPMISNSYGGSDYMSAPTEDKYKRKNPIQGVRRWIRNQFPLEETYHTTRRNLVMVLIICTVIVIFIILMTRTGHRTRAMDSNMDWKFNPNIKTGQ